MKDTNTLVATGLGVVAGLTVLYKLHVRNKEAKNAEAKNAQVSRESAKKVANLVTTHFEAEAEKLEAKAKAEKKALHTVKALTRFVNKF